MAVTEETHYSPFFMVEKKKENIQILHAEMVSGGETMVTDLLKDSLGCSKF